MENQYFDQDGNLFTSLCKSNVGTPFDSKISSIKASPLILDSVSTPGTGFNFKIKTPGEEVDNKG